MSTRAERRAERRKQKARSRAPQRAVPWFSALVVGVLLVGGFLLLRNFGVFESSSSAIVTGPDINPAQVTPNVGQQVPTMDATHIDLSQSFTQYNTTPPNSGPHWNAAGRGPIGWGVYTTQQRNEGVVHNLEHGGVLIAYDPSVSDQDVANLNSIRRRWPKDRFSEVKIIIEPYAGLGQGTIAMTAWGYIDKMTTYDERRIQGFIAAHIDRGPEDAP